MIEPFIFGRNRQSPFGVIEFGKNEERVKELQSPMNDLKASLAIGTALVVLGIALFRWHLMSWRKEREDPAIEERDRHHYRLRFRRRAQVSILLILLGILIPLGDAWMMQRKDPAWIALFWIGVLLMALWIMLLGALDWLSNRIHFRSTRAAIAGLAQKRRELEVQVAAELERLKRERSNGRE